MDRCGVRKGLKKLLDGSDGERKGIKDRAKALRTVRCSKVMERVRSRTAMERVRSKKVIECQFFFY